MKTNELIKQSLLAAIYVVLTVVVAPQFSFGAIQFRVSEVLLILVLFNPRYWIGLVIGTFISNLFSPLGLVDWVVGTSASALSIYLMLMFKSNIWVSLSMPVLVNALMVGLELKLVLGLPFFISALQVGFGQFVVVMIVGGLLFQALKNNEGFKKLINH